MPAEAPVSAAGLAAYVHVPFCGRVCPYCDFAVVAGRDDMIDRYFGALWAEIDMEPPTGPLVSVFVGGGTPSRVAPALLGETVERLAHRFGFAGDVEVSLEANPEDWTRRRAQQLVGAGFNRVSFGVQSFDDVVLQGLGRLHNARQASEVLDRARAAGFASISLDLIFGSPAETTKSWEETVDTAIGLEPAHVSTYALTVERGTELSRLVASGAPGPDPDDQADKYEMARAALTGAGFAHYEVSNYARPGHECVYNLNTWAQGDYLGFGLGAHGHRGGVRRRNVRRLDAYLAKIEAGNSPEAGREVISGWERELERVFLGVRMRPGTEAGEVGALLSSHPEGKALVGAGKLEVAAGRITVLDPLFTDAVARVVLDLASTRTD